MLLSNVLKLCYTVLVTIDKASTAVKKIIPNLYGLTQKSSSLVYISHLIEISKVYSCSSIYTDQGLWFLFFLFFNLLKI